MDIEAALTFLLVIGLATALLVKLARVGAQRGSYYQPERRHYDWGPEARRPRSDWAAGPRIR